MADPTRAAMVQRRRRLEAVRRRLERGERPLRRRGRVPDYLKPLPLPPIRRVPFGGEAFDIEALHG